MSEQKTFLEWLDEFDDKKAYERLLNDPNLKLDIDALEVHIYQATMGNAPTHIWKPYTELPTELNELNRMATTSTFDEIFKNHNSALDSLKNHADVMFTNPANTITEPPKLY